MPTCKQLQKYEKGVNECRFINIIKLSEYLGVDVDYFYKPLVENNLKFLTKRERKGGRGGNGACREWITSGGAVGRGGCDEV